ncbi:hypothetical protein HDU87_007127 [Geranomyces variabilis]|uniref:Amidohydrolase 3 domain-containing protein n=1 Tax=Geranomyces variabilis TaxID=109894 RepID=A0AAD5XKL7_9FUNG|nr:hypothetical protein HDU87_007127 [Geranomyces variabilis]
MRNRLGGSPPKSPCASDEVAALLPGGLRVAKPERPSTSWKILAALVVIGAALVIVATCLIRRTRKEESYYLVHNAVVHTVDPAVQRAEAFVVKDGRFVAVGTYAQLKQEHPAAVGFDAKQQNIVPGLIDSHGHLIEQGLAFLQADVTGSASISAVRQNLIRYLDANPVIEREGDWVTGKGWDQTIWPETSFKFPNATDLDVDHRLAKVPICLFRLDYHAFWLNTAALERVASYLPEPGVPIDGGEAIRDANGHLTGVLLDRAMDMIEGALPQPSEARVKEALKAVTRNMVENGLTGLHDAGVPPWQMRALRKAIDEKRMPIRNYAMVRCPNPEKYCGDLFEKGTYGDRLTVGSVKLFLDGAVGSWGAAMLDPYSDDSSKSGFLRLPEKIIPDLIAEWADNGFQVNIHCIGDRANKLALDGFESYFSQHGVNGTERRMRIEHAQIIAEADIARFASLGVIPSMQPTHATTDMSYVEKRLGPKRVRGAYAWRSLLSAGVKHIALGSDFPIEGVNPLLGIHAAVTRLDPAGHSPHGPNGWFPEQKLTPMEALRGFTLDAAWAAFQEDELGSIAVGKKADFAVFDRDFLSNGANILQAKCVATFVDGQAVFGMI